MSETFFTADTHFSHFNIIRYCSRPFESIEEMNWSLIENWNNVVSPDDIVWHLGDFALGPVGMCNGLLHQLNGTKYLITGNHDANEKRMLAVGFKEVHKRYQWKEWWLVHRPRSAPEGCRVLCGHVHNNWRRKGWYINTGVDVWDFKPQTVDELIKAPMESETYDGF